MTLNQLFMDNNEGCFYNIVVNFFSDYACNICLKFLGLWVVINVGLLSL
jgi:hypothetical protein